MTGELSDRTGPENRGGGLPLTSSGDDREKPAVLVRRKGKTRSITHQNWGGKKKGEWTLHFPSIEKTKKGKRPPLDVERKPQPSDP